MSRRCESFDCLPGDKLRADSALLLLLPISAPLCFPCKQCTDTSQSELPSMTEVRCFGLPRTTSRDWHGSVGGGALHFGLLALPPCLYTVHSTTYITCFVAYRRIPPFIVFPLAHDFDEASGEQLKGPEATRREEPEDEEEEELGDEPDVWEVRVRGVIGKTKIPW